MAKITFGIGTSHSVQMNSSPEAWAAHAARDRSTPGLIDAGGNERSYADLLATADRDRLAPELTLAVRTEKFARAQRAVGRLTAALAESRPDVVVIVGDDQKELFRDDCMPAIAMYTGKSLWDHGITEDKLARYPEDVRPSLSVTFSDKPDEYPIAQDLSAHLVESLAVDDFDIAVMSEQPKDRGLGHAYTIARRRLGLPVETPIVPIFLNTYFPPNVPSPARCYALGQALRRGIESWSGDERVAVVASGGLSHFVVLEDLDRTVLDALRTRDTNKLFAIPRRLLRSGNSEILNWIAAAGALENLEMEVVDYLPGYRSEAGTGTGLSYAIWTESAP
jgi:hypothetical protein